MDYAEKLTPEQFKHVHARIQQKGYNAETGEAVNKPYVQVFSEKEFDKFHKHAEGLGYKVEILHDPRKKKPNPIEEAAEIELDKARKEWEQLFGKKAHAQKSAESLRKEVAEYHEYQNVLEAWQNAMGVKTTPTISKDEMIEDIRRMKKKEETVQQTSDRQKAEADEAEAKRVEEQAKKQAEN